MKVGHPLTKFARNRHGGVLVIVAAAIPLLLAGVALMVDYNHYLKVKSEIDNTIDQAVLSAASADSEGRAEQVRNFFELNFPAEYRNQVEITEWNVNVTDPSTGALRVSADVSAKLNTTFAAFVGVSTLNVSHHAEAIRNVENVEAVLTLASSGTMCAFKERFANTSAIVPGDTLIGLKEDNNCTHFNKMKQGVQEFADIMEENETIGDFKAGLVPYNYKVKMPGNQVPPVLSDNEVEKFYEELDDAEPLAKILSLTNRSNDLTSALNKMKQSPEGTAWSRSNIATAVAALMLDPEYSSYFPGGEKPQPFGTANTKKIVILMGDGVNAGCCYTNWPEGNFQNQYVYFYEPDNKEQIDICTAMKDNGVTVFSILFDVNEGDAGGAEISNVFARCASGAYNDPAVSEADPSAMLKCTKKTNCYDVKTDDDLVTAYKDIALTFYAPRLSE